MPISDELKKVTWSTQSKTRNGKYAEILFHIIVNGIITAYQIKKVNKTTLTLKCTVKKYNAFLSIESPLNVVQADPGTNKNKRYEIDQSFPETVLFDFQRWGPVLHNCSRRCRTVVTPSWCSTTQHEQNCKEAFLSQSKPAYK